MSIILVFKSLGWYLSSALIYSRIEHERLGPFNQERRYCQRQPRRQKLTTFRAIALLQYDAKDCGS